MTTTSEEVQLTLAPGSLGVGIYRQETDGTCVVSEKNNAASPLQVGDVIVRLNGVTLADVKDGVKGWVALFQASASRQRNVVVRRVVNPSPTAAVAVAAATNNYSSAGAPTDNSTKNKVTAIRSSTNTMAGNDEGVVDLMTPPRGGDTIYIDRSISPPAARPNSIPTNDDDSTNDGNNEKATPVKETNQNNILPAGLYKSSSDDESNSRNEERLRDDDFVNPEDEEEIVAEVMRRSMIEITTAATTTAAATATTTATTTATAAYSSNSKKIGKKRGVKTAELPRVSFSPSSQQQSTRPGDHDMSISVVGDVTYVTMPSQLPPSPHSSSLPQDMAKLALHEQFQRRNNSNSNYISSLNRNPSVCFQPPRNDWNVNLTNGTAATVHDALSDAPRVRAEVSGGRVGSSRASSSASGAPRARRATKAPRAPPPPLSKDIIRLFDPVSYPGSKIPLYSCSTTEDASCVHADLEEGLRLINNPKDNSISALRRRVGLRTQAIPASNVGRREGNIVVGVPFLGLPVELHMGVDAEDQDLGWNNDEEVGERITQLCAQISQHWSRVQELGIVNRADFIACVKLQNAILSIPTKDGDALIRALIGTVDEIGLGAAQAFMPQGGRLGAPPVAQGHRVISTAQGINGMISVSYKFRVNPKAAVTVAAAFGALLLTWHHRFRLFEDADMLRVVVAVINGDHLGAVQALLGIPDLEDEDEAPLVARQFDKSITSIDKQFRDKRAQFFGLWDIKYTGTVLKQLKKQYDWFLTVLRGLQGSQRNQSNTETRLRDALLRIARSMREVLGVSNDFHLAVGKTDFPDAIKKDPNIKPKTHRFGSGKLKFWISDLTHKVPMDAIFNLVGNLTRFIYHQDPDADDMYYRKLTLTIINDDTDEFERSLFE